MIRNSSILGRFNEFTSQWCNTQMLRSSHKEIYFNLIIINCVTVCRGYREKAGRRLFCPPPFLPYILNRVKDDVLGEVSSIHTTAKFVHS